MLQDDLAATLEEFLRLQEEFSKMTNAQNEEKQKEKSIQEKTDIPGIKHTEEFRRPRITPINFRWLDTMNGLQGSFSIRNRALEKRFAPPNIQEY